MRTRISVSVIAVTFILVAGLVSFKKTVPVHSAARGNRILQRALDIEMGALQRHPKEPLLSSGTMYAALGAIGELDRRAAAAGPEFARAVAGFDIAPSSDSTFSKRKTEGCQNVFTGAGPRNVRVNQDCSFRRQAEEFVAINPLDSRNLIAGYNDSRIGFNHMAYAWSFDRGHDWGDMVPPFWSFLLGDGHAADAGSDPSGSFDSEGNAYITGVFFQAFSAASAILVSKSNAAFGGAFYHSPAPGTFQALRTGVGVVASDNDPNVFNDKEFIVADAGPASPKANNVYVTWTRFAVTGAGIGVNSPIYFSQSVNGGATWSPGIEISGANGAICTGFSGSADPAACDQDQGSHPIAGPDGTVYVVFGNFNTPLLGVNQVLLVSCPPGADCSDPSSWTAPVKVADLVGTHPIGPDPATGCPAGRQCLPPNGYRVPEFTSMSVSVDSHQNLFVAWSDTRNIGANCDFDGGVLGSAQTATPPCDNDVFYSLSTNGGAT
jgi:hypothetical protein